MQSAPVISVFNRFVIHPHAGALVFQAGWGLLRWPPAVQKIKTSAVRMKGQRLAKGLRTRRAALAGMGFLPADCHAGVRPPMVLPVALRWLAG